MNEPQAAPAPKPKEKTMSVSRTIMRKLLIIAFIFAVLQIPLMLITGVIEERKTYNVDYPLEYRGYGAGQQTIIGPVLSVPYKYQISEEQSVNTQEQLGSVVKVTRTHVGNLHFFPEDLTVSGHLQPQIRDEGKFKSIRYSTILDVKGSFNTADFKSKKINEEDLMWQDAFIAVGISDLRGISKQTVINWDGSELKFIPGTNNLKLFDAGQHAPLPGFKKGGSHKFSFALNLRGSRDLNVFPAGKTNKITLSSSWNDPQYTGGFLPINSAITKDGFKALWEVSYFSRNLPQIWTDSDPDITNSLAQYMVGATLSTPVEFYQTTVRAVKYGSLFIVLTFLALFVFEMIVQIRIHEIQYLLVGLALSLFFLLLIGISEWMPFAWAYILASFPTIVQITCYTQAAFSKTNKELWKIMAATLTVLYIYLYVLLQLENFSLLFGSIGLFVALSLVMYVIRNFNWYAEDVKAS